MLDVYGMCVYVDTTACTLVSKAISKGKRVEPNERSRQILLMASSMTPRGKTHDSYWLPFANP